MIDELYAWLVANALPKTDIGSQHVGPSIKAAQIILGVDAMTNKLNVFYGREKVREIFNEAEARRLAVVVFHYDQRDDSLERLCEVIHELKGSHCYMHAEPEPVAKG